jgi:hypothetical protein
VVVPAPATAGPIDLGLLEIPLDAGVAGTPPPIPTLSLRAPDGAPFDLASFRGRAVLVTFWAPWAQPSTDELAQIKQLQAKRSGDLRFAMLSVELDRDPEVSGRLARELSWTPSSLEGAEKTRATEAWRIDSLPTTFLIAPEGWVQVRDLQPARFLEAVESALETSR